MNSIHKQDIDKLQNIQINLQQMFPRVSNLINEKTKDQLQKFYRKDQHVQYLTHVCYRCHKLDIIQFYEEFKMTYHSQLEQPTISKYYRIAQWIANQKSNENYPGTYITPIPNNLPKLLDQLFTEYGYIPNFQRLLLFYPTYLSKHLALSRQLFESQTMNHSTVYFVAICAAAQLGSIYMMSRMLRKYKESGGPVDWLTNKKYPHKYRVLLELNRKLARSLWQIDSSFIEYIIQVGKWQKSQLTFMCLVMSFIHQMCTICLGMGLIQEQKYDILQMQHIRKIQQIYQNQTYQKISKKYIQIQSKIKQQKKYISRKSAKKQQRRIQNNQLIEGYMRQIGKQLTQQNLYKQIFNNLIPLLPQFNIIQKRDDQIYSPMDYSDFNFKFNALPVLNNLVGKLSDLFIDLIEQSQNMTLRKQNQSISSIQQAIKNQLNQTKYLRKAICYYSENLCGYKHLQYDYKNLKEYLSMPLKFQIRLLTYSPVHITRQVLLELLGQQKQILNCSHTTLLVANTKMSLTLTMFIRGWIGIDSYQ